MESRKYDIKTLMMEPEYKITIRTALDSKSKEGHLFLRDKHIKELMSAYENGGLTLEDAAEIMQILVERVQGASGRLDMSNLGAFSVLRGTCGMLANVMKALVETEEANPDLTAQQIEVKSMDRIQELRFG